MRLIVSLAAMLFFSAPAFGASGNSVFDSWSAASPSLRLEEGTDLSPADSGGGFLYGTYNPGDGPYSPYREGAFSFLLPGMGQHRMGRHTRAKVYFGLEAVTWIVIGASVWQGYAREDAYEEYAVVFADVYGIGLSDDYYENIGSYMSNDGPGGYNEAVRREARDLFYPDVGMMEAYYEENKITGELSWHWRSDDERTRYNDLRNGSRMAFRRALYAVVFGLTLRLVSSVDAVRMARSDRPEAGVDTGGLSMTAEPLREGFAVFVKKSF